VRVTTRLSFVEDIIWSFR